MKELLVESSAEAPAVSGKLWHRQAFLRMADCPGLWIALCMAV
jgi:hypothetical protein